MGQHEVYQILKSKEWMTAQDIAKILGCNANGVRRCLKVMYEFGELIRKEIKLLEHGYRYAYRII